MEAFRSKWPFISIFMSVGNTVPLIYYHMFGFGVDREQGFSADGWASAALYMHHDLP